MQLLNSKFTESFQCLGVTDAHQNTYNLWLVWFVQDFKQILKQNQMQAFERLWKYYSWRVSIIQVFNN